MDFFDLKNDTRATTGIGSQLNVWDENLKKYVILIPLEGVPSVVGSTNTVEVDLLTSSMITKITGKTTVDDKDQEFLWHRDNLLRLSQFAGKQCKFLVSYPDFTGWKFTGEIKVRANDTTSDKLTGTFTIVASDVDKEPTMNCFDLLARTAFITSEVPAVVEFSGTNKSKTVELASSISTATFTATSDNSNITATVSNKELSISVTGTTTTSGQIEIKSIAENHGSWVTTILVIYKAE